MSALGFEDRMKQSAVKQRIVQTDVGRQVGSYIPQSSRLEILRPQQRELPVCPEYLGAKGKKMWDTILGSLNYSHVLPTVQAGLETYIWTYLQWQKVRRAIDRDGFLVEDDDGNIRPHPLADYAMKITFQMRGQYRQLLVAFECGNQKEGFAEKLTKFNDAMQQASARGSLIGGENVAEAA